jgi:hypothetical protein
MNRGSWLVLLGILTASACDEDKASSAGTATAVASPTPAPPPSSTTIPTAPPAPPQASAPPPIAPSAAAAASTTPAPSAVAAAPAGSTTTATPTTLTVVASQFTDRVEKSNPVGDSSALASVPKATYWMDIANPGEATQLTLVWKHDGQEVTRQSLDVGRAPHWRTWGSHPRRMAHLIEVLVLDGAGNTLKTDSATIAAPVP